MHKNDTCTMTLVSIFVEVLLERRNNELCYPGGLLPGVRATAISRWYLLLHLRINKHR
jgi:hypothetical protein